MQPLALRRRIYRQANAVISPIAFSMTLDDYRVIDRALALAPGERVVCLASAGDTPLNLLRSDPAEVVAVDISGPQVSLTRLKQAGARVLPLPEYRRLLGVVPAHDGVESLYQRVRPELDDKSRKFWDANIDLLRRGVLWQGAVQRLSAYWGPLVRLRVGLARPELLRGNPYLGPLLLGVLPDEEFFPPYLSADAYPAIQRNADRLTVVHRDVREYLRERPSASVDAFALSNIADWLPRSEVPGLLADIARVARDGARVLLCGHRRACRIPAPLRDRLVPDPALQHELRAMDRVRYFRKIGLFRVAG